MRACLPRCMVVIVAKEHTEQINAYTTKSQFADDAALYATSAGDFVRDMTSNWILSLHKTTGMHTIQEGHPIDLPALRSIQ